MKPCELWFWLQQAEVAMYNNVPRRCRVDPSAVGAKGGNGQRHVNLRKTGRQAFCATNVQRKQTCVVSAPEAHGYLNILHNYLQRHI